MNNIGSGKEASFREGCLSLRSSTIEKLRASQSPGFSGNIPPGGIGRQTLSKFRSQPAVGWGHYTEGLKDKGRPVENAQGKATPGPQYQLDRLTYGQQVQSRFTTAPTPVFGSSKRRPLNDAGTVSPGPMTAMMGFLSPPPGPKYSIAGAPWRKEQSGDTKTPGPGQYRIDGALGEQRESTRPSFKGFSFGGEGIGRDMTLPSSQVPGPGHYDWHKRDRPVQPGVTFGSAAQRPVESKESLPGPSQYSIPSTLGTAVDSRFRTVVAPGFGKFSEATRPHSASSRLGIGSHGPGPGQYDVSKLDTISVAKRPLSRDKSCPSYKICAPTVRPRVPPSGREPKRDELDPEKLRRAVKLTKKGCRVPDISFGVGPQRPLETLDKQPGPQAYDPESLRRAISASRASPLRGVKFGTGPQRYNVSDSDHSPGPNAGYKIPSTMGPQVNSIFKSVNAPSFGTVPSKAAPSGEEPGPCTYKPTMSNRPKTTRGISFGGDGGRGLPRRENSPGPGAYIIGSAMGRQTSSRYKSSPAPSLRAR